MEYLEIGKRIKAIRENKGISQKDAARQIGIQQSTLSKYERGIQNPRFQELCLMADWFGVSVDYLLCRTEIPSIPTDGKLQAAAEYTKLSEGALQQLNILEPQMAKVLSMLLETPLFYKVLSLIVAKLHSIKVGKTNGIKGIINKLPQKIQVYGEDFHVNPDILSDSLIQTEFLRAVDCLIQVNGGAENGKHNPSKE